MVDKQTTNNKQSGGQKCSPFLFGELENNSYIGVLTKLKTIIMAKYYSVTVAVEVEDAKGKIKKNKEQYLVDALSVTEAEAKLVKKFTDDAVRLEYEVVKVSETKIIEVF